VAHACTLKDTSCLHYKSIQIRLSNYSLFNCRMETEARLLFIHEFTEKLPVKFMTGKFIS